MNDLNKYKGVVVPMVTPLTEDYKIDEIAVSKILNLFGENRVNALILGTTGEVASLTSEQKSKLVEAAVRAVPENTVLMAGLMGNSLPELIDEGKKYAGMGIEAVAALVPNYFPLRDKHILLWFEKLADALPLPVFLYNIPATTHHEISLDVVETLSHHSNIIGIKDSQPGAERLEESLQRWAERNDFLFLVGNAVNSCLGLKLGADGLVPSAGNIFPELYKAMYVAAQKGDFDECERLQQLTNRISALYQGNRILSEAIPALKMLMSVKGLCGPQVMPPMQKMDTETEKIFRAETVLNLFNLESEQV